MSKLPKAPLIEVIFELRWNFSPQELREIQYLHGDLYPLIKDVYPFRETLQGIPIELLVNTPLLTTSPTHRFRTAANDYPLVQVGPGVLTVNTIDPKYFWDEYEKQILDVVTKFWQVYSLKKSHNVRLVLQYIDLIEFNFDKDDVIKFLEENLNISLKQGFYKQNSNTKNLVLMLSFENDLGILNLTINRGRNSNGAEGITIQTNLSSNQIDPKIKNVEDWLHNAHELCSTSFKEMTKGRLYNSFLK